MSSNSDSKITISFLLLWNVFSPPKNCITQLRWFFKLFDFFHISMNIVCNEFFFFKLKVSKPKRLLWPWTTPLSLSLPERLTWARLLVRGLLHQGPGAGWVPGLSRVCWSLSWWLSGDQHQVSQSWHCGSRAWWGERREWWWPMA